MIYLLLILVLVAAFLAKGGPLTGSDGPNIF